MSQKPESQFWSQLKSGLLKARNDVILTRIENASTPGIPDILLCDEKNNFHLIELKVSKGNVVKLSPHQVAFAVKHSEANVWVLVKKLGKTARDYTVFLFKGPQIFDLVRFGLNKTEPSLSLSAPIDYDSLYLALV